MEGKKEERELPKIKKGRLIRYKELEKPPPIIKECPVCGGKEFEKTKRHNETDPDVYCTKCRTKFSATID